MLRPLHAPARLVARRRVDVRADPQVADRDEGVRRDRAAARGRASTARRRSPGTNASANADARGRAGGNRSPPARNRSVKPSSSHDSGKPSAIARRARTRARPSGPVQPPRGPMRAAIAAAASAGGSGATEIQAPRERRGLRRSASARCAREPGARFEQRARAAPRPCARSARRGRRRAASSAAGCAAARGVERRERRARHVPRCRERARVLGGHRVEQPFRVAHLLGEALGVLRRARPARDAAPAARRRRR